MTDLEHLLREHGAAPEHRPDFESRLWAAVAVAGPGAEAGTVTEKAATGTRTATRLRVGRSRRIALIAAAAVAIAAVALGVALTRRSVQEFAYPEPASAAEVAANVRTALSRIRTLHADATDYVKIVKGPPASKWRKDWTTADWWARARIYSDDEFEASGIENGHPYFPTGHIVATADGRWRKDSPENYPEDPPVIVDQSSGDEAAGIGKVYWPGMALHVISDTSLGAPDDGAVGHSGVGTPELSLRFIQPATLSAMAHGSMNETTYDGRAALTISCSIAPRPIAGLNMEAHSFDTLEFTVDRETWLIVRTSYLLRGQVIWQSSLSNVRVNEPVTDAQLEPSPAPRTKVRNTSEGFRRVSFAEAAHAFATRPYAPQVLPAGFDAFAAAVKKRAKFTYWHSADGPQSHYWPAGRDVTQLSYRAGLLRFVVTTRAQPSGGPMPADVLVTDPFVHDFESAEEDRAYIGSMERVTLNRGALSGVTAYLVTPLLASPHMWAWHDGILVTITGDLTSQQLLDVANSLEPMD